MPQRVYSSLITVTIETLPGDLVASWVVPTAGVTGDFSATLRFNQPVAAVTFDTFVLVRTTSPGFLYTLSTGDATITNNNDNTYTIAVDVSELFNTEIDADFDFRLLANHITYQGTLTGPATDVTSDTFNINTFVAARWTGSVTGTFRGNTNNNRIRDLLAVSSGTDRTFSVGTLPPQITRAVIENNDELVFDVGEIAANVNVQLPLIVTNPGGSDTLNAVLTLVPGAAGLWQNADGENLWTDDSDNPLWSSE